MNLLHLSNILQSCSRNTYCLRKLAKLSHSSHRLYIRRHASRSSSEVHSENINVGHSRFLAEAPPAAKWSKGSESSSQNAGEDDQSFDEFSGITEGRGKLSPTSSHLFKLILPLGSLSHPSNTRTEPLPSHLEKSKSNPSAAPATPPTVILLHPSQPLSHVSRLILASLAPATPAISFRSISDKGQAFQWSDSTDVGDFIRDAARAARFSICITYGDPAPGHPSLEQAASRYVPVKDDSGKEKKGIRETIIDVEVPTFADRTRFLRRRLGVIEGKLQEMEKLKNQCDKEAHHGAKRMAVGGFAMLVVYWGAVARLTFWDFGWDVMEPITYLSGLSTVIVGYLWFLYQGREVSYSSVLDRSISSRREALYKTHGLDIEQWMDLVGERKTLRKEIGRIAEDYEQGEKRKPVEEFEEESELDDKDPKSGGNVDKLEVGERVLKRESDEEEQRGKREGRKADLGESGGAL